MPNTATVDLLDHQLADAVLFVTDVAHLIGALSTAPPANTSPEIVFEYELSAEAPAQRCCFCKGHTRHRRGFLVTFGTADHYLVGSHCGPAHLDLAFRMETGAHSKRRDRQSAVRRLRDVAATTSAIIEWCNALLFHSQLHEVEKAGERFKAAAGDAYFRLHALAVRRGELREMVTVRDRAAEAMRDARLSQGQSGTPIYRDEPVSIGRLRGVGLFTPERLRTAIFAAKQQAETVASVAAKPTEAENTKRLRSIVVDFDKAVSAAREAAIDLAQVPRFFDADHLRLVERWAKDTTIDALHSDAGGLLVGVEAQRTLLPRMQPADLPEFPNEPVLPFRVI